MIETKTTRAKYCFRVPNAPIGIPSIILEPEGGGLPAIAGVHLELEFHPGTSPKLVAQIADLLNKNVRNLSHTSTQQSASA